MPNSRQVAISAAASYWRCSSPTIFCKSFGPTPSISRKLAGRRRQHGRRRAEAFEQFLSRLRPHAGNERETQEIDQFAILAAVPICHELPREHVERLGPH